MRLNPICSPDWPNAPACGYSYVGGRKTKKNRGKAYLIRYYSDTSALRMMGKFRDVHCEQSQISCHRLDAAVWKVISQILLEPEILIESMERQFMEGPNGQLLKEIDYLNRQLGDLDVEDEDLYRAYHTQAFDAPEYAARHEHVKEQRKKTKEISGLEARVMTRERLGAQ